MISKSNGEKLRFDEQPKQYDGGLLLDGKGRFVWGETPMHVPDGTDLPAEPEPLTHVFFADEELTRSAHTFRQPMQERAR